MAKKKMTRLEALTKAITYKPEPGWPGNGTAFARTFSGMKCELLKNGYIVEDEQAADGYFIFDKGENSVYSFKVRGLPEWTFGVWFDIRHDPKYDDKGCRAKGSTPVIEMEFFGQPTRFIDKFKPMASNLCQKKDISVDSQGYPKDVYSTYSQFGWIVSLISFCANPKTKWVALNDGNTPCLRKIKYGEVRRIWKKAIRDDEREKRRTKKAQAKVFKLFIRKFNDAFDNSSYLSDNGTRLHSFLCEDLFQDGKYDVSLYSKYIKGVTDHDFKTVGKYADKVYEEWHAKVSRFIDWYIRICKRYYGRDFNKYCGFLSKDEFNFLEEGINISIVDEDGKELLGFPIYDSATEKRLDEQEAEKKDKRDERKKKSAPKSAKGDYDD